MKRLARLDHRPAACVGKPIYFYANPKGLQNFTDKHPAIRTFARSPSRALMRVDVERVSLVSRFQEVMEADIDDLV